jgi:dynein heavy chain 1
MVPLSRSLLIWFRSHLAQKFSAEIDALIGDSVLASAYLAYAGFYEKNQRNLLVSEWKDHLKRVNINFTANFSLAEYLSTQDARQEWQTNGLASDDLAVENSIMLFNFNRYWDLCAL